jgi:hypothetical protein
MNYDKKEKAASTYSTGKSLKILLVNFFESLGMNPRLGDGCEAAPGVPHC